MANLFFVIISNKNTNGLSILPLRIIQEEDTVGIPEPLPIPPPDNTVESQEIFRSKVGM